jgi:low affinity Fe/Cu permease
MSHESRPSLRDHFQTFARKVAEAVGSPWAFLLALGIVIAWGVTGPLFGFSDTWQLVINTGTTIVTFIMVFLIQSTQNRDAKAMHLKLDEVIRAIRTARNDLIDLEDLPERDLDALAARFAKIHKRASEEARKRPAK